jgi:hypothetical protein
MTDVLLAFAASARLLVLPIAALVLVVESG